VTAPQASPARERQPLQAGLIGKMRMVGSEMARPQPAPALPAATPVEYPPFERLPAHASGRAAGVIGMQSKAESPMSRP